MDSLWKMAASTEDKKGWWKDEKFSLQMQKYENS